MIKVIDLEVGNEFKFESTTLIVRVIDRQKGKVISTKKTAKWPYGQVSHSFYSHQHKDLMNRVELV